MYSLLKYSDLMQIHFCCKILGSVEGDSKDSVGRKEEKVGGDFV